MKKILMTIAGLVLSTNLFAAVTEQAVPKHYTDLAHAMYSDSPSTVKTLQKAVNTFIARPTESNMQVTRDAWIAARHPYQQTEAYRFGNAIVDDWEGKVNA